MENLSISQNTTLSEAHKEDKGIMELNDIFIVVLKVRVHLSLSQWKQSFKPKVKFGLGYRVQGNSFLLTFIVFKFMILILFNLFFSL